MVTLGATALPQKAYTHATSSTCIIGYGLCKGLGKALLCIEARPDGSAALRQRQEPGHRRLHALDAVGHLCGMYMIQVVHLQ